MKGVWFQVKVIADSDPILADKRGQPLMGHCTNASCTIWIADSLAIQMKWATLIHEWVHLIGDGFDEIDICRGESGVEYVAGEVLKLFRHIDKTLE